MKTMTALLVALMLALPAHAREIDGVAVPDTLSIDDAPLTLNGAGMRTRFFVKVYLAALYLAQPAHEAQRVLDSQSPRAVGIHLRRDVDAGQIGDAFIDGVAANHSDAEMAALQERLTKFKALMPDLKRGDVLRLEFAADGNTRVVRNGQRLGALEGVDFQRALLKIWLGERPVDTKLKDGLLGVQG